MCKKVFLGIDTSCYVTSVAIVDGDLNLLGDERHPLAVPYGKKGLRQQDAVFSHVKNLSGVIDSIMKNASKEGTLHLELAGVGASVSPRSEEDSYMPVFKVGEMAGRVIASTWSVPFFSLSHQEGHIAAGIWSQSKWDSEDFLAIHISGGTTEFLRVNTVSSGNTRLYIKDMLGGSEDLHAGQFIDRVGVHMGLPFPAGPDLEILARQGDPDKVHIPSSVNGLKMSFSGPATCGIKALKDGADPRDVAAAVERCIANTLEKVIRRGVDITGLNTVLIVGGVAANEGIKARLRHRLKGIYGDSLYFAVPKYTGDNAVGIAVETARRLREVEKIR